MSFLGVSWEALGSLLEPLGAILGRLGAKLCGLGATFGALDFLLLFGAILVAKRVPKGRHFGSQNGANIDKQKRCKFKSEKVTSWSRLGAIFTFLIKMGVQERSETKTGAKREPTWHQHGSQNGSKIDRKI